MHENLISRVHQFSKDFPCMHIIRLINKSSMYLIAVLSLVTGYA